jgi:hypothetical protein
LAAADARARYRFPGRLALTSAESMRLPHALALPFLFAAATAPLRRRRQAFSAPMVTTAPAFSQCDRPETATSALPSRSGFPAATTLRSGATLGRHRKAGVTKPACGRLMQRTTAAPTSQAERKAECLLRYWHSCAALSALQFRSPSMKSPSMD